jgi:hypothetical protein
MESKIESESFKGPEYLVEDRIDFLIVYLSSFGTMVAFLLGSWVVQTPDMPFIDLVGDFSIAIFGMAVIALLPPLIARYLKTGRRIAQFVFGAFLVPLIAGVVINGMSILRALQ